MTASTVLSTDDLTPRDRAPQWREWVYRHFGGLDSDLYGDTDFDGHMASSRAGDVILTRLEANRHRVLRTPHMARGSETGYLKIVAPWQGSASVEQHSRQAGARSGGWVIYDTTGSYAIANPEHAPYGVAAVAAMKTAGVYEAAESKLVLGENVAQAAEFALSGNAQVGVFALSLAMSPQFNDKGRYVEVPLDSYPRIDQGGVVLASAADPAAARAVKDFLLSDAGLAILRSYGFFLPGA